MKRLTEKRNGKNVIPLRRAVCGIDMPYWAISGEAYDLERFFAGDAADRLAAYEDTGLEPADIEDLLAKDTNVPDKNVGEWKSKTMSVPGGHGQTYNRWGCSKCKARVKTRTKYCPNCGAEMKGE